MTFTPHDAAEGLRILAGELASEIVDPNGTQDEASLAEVLARLEPGDLAHISPFSLPWLILDDIAAGTLPFPIRHIAHVARANLVEALRDYLASQRCRVCGCNDNLCVDCVEASGEPCHWVEPDLCSRCAPEAAKP